MLGGHVHSWDIEGLQHDSSFFLGWLGTQVPSVSHIGAPWGQSLIILEGLGPDLLHVIW